MKTFIKKLYELGKVERFEVRNNSIVLFLIGPSLFLYSLFIDNYDDDKVRIQGAREVFSLVVTRCDVEEGRCN